jgi:ribosome-binding protein aMBF1 (putative translation factor)
MAGWHGTADGADEMRRGRTAGAETPPARPGRGVHDDAALASQIARAIVRARTAAGLSQAALATRMGTSQPFVAKLESGRALPSTSTLVKVARATGTLLRVELVALTRSVASAALPES